MATKKQKMTKDILEKLKGISVATGTLTYTVEIDGVPAKYLPVFTLKALMVDEHNKVRESEDNEAMVNNLLREHIIGWDNLYDITTGETFEFQPDDTGVCSKEQYALLPGRIRISLLAYLYEIAGM